MMNTIKKYTLLTILSIIIGIIIGSVDAIFGRVLLEIGDIRNRYFLYVIPFFAMAGLGIVFLYQTVGKSVSKGMGLVFQVGHGVGATIPKRLIPLIISTTWITHLFGGSAGREGVAVQLGATISHWFARFSKTSDISKILLVTGMASGFAGLFQTPLAATFFALEVLVVGELFFPALYPALLASLVSSWTSNNLGLEKFTFNLQTPFISMLTAGLVLKLLLLGIIFGLCGTFFASGLSWSKKQFSNWLPNPYLRIGILGVSLSILFMVVGMGRYSGLGTNLISLSLEGHGIDFYDWFVKLAFTILTLAAGYQGGEVTPLFAIGASLGFVLAPCLGIPISLAASLGYASVFGSATSTVIAPILIGGEVFGFENIPYFVIVCSIAFLIAPKRSIYAEQKLSEKYR